MDGHPIITIAPLEPEKFIADTLVTQMQIEYIILLGNIGHLSTFVHLNKKSLK